MNELDPKLVGRVIAYYRKSRKLSQEVLSGLAGICRTHLSAIERGERKPTMETFYRICCAMNMRMSDVTYEMERRMRKK
jgi:transcriptional regulator with XRE-family HTH domain